MGEHKGTITIILAVLVIFGIFIIFADEVFQPIMDKIGTQFNELVDGVFKSVENVKVESEKAGG